MATRTDKFHTRLIFLLSTVYIGGVGGGQGGDSVYMCPPEDRIKR